MSQKRAIITILNTIGPTSMPFNEFSLYRAKHFPDEEHCVVVLGPVKESFVEEHKQQWANINVKVICCQASYLKLKQRLEEMLINYKNKGIESVIHLHQPRSALAVQILNLLFIRKVPTLFTIHNMVYTAKFPRRVLWYANFITADRISFVSHYTQSVFPRFLKRFRANSIHSIPNGVDIERVNRFIADSATTDAATCMSSDSSQIQNGFKLINIGRLNKQKNKVGCLDC